MAGDEQIPLLQDTSTSPEDVPEKAPEQEQEQPPASPDASPEGEQPQAEADTAAGDDTPEPRGTRRWQKRVDKLTAKVRSLESGLAQATQALQARTPVQEPAEPRPDQFATYEDYLKALTSHEIEKRVGQRPEPAPAPMPVDFTDEAEDSFEAAREEIPDFDDVVFNPTAIIRQEWVQALSDSPVSAKVLYHLAKNTKEAAALARMSLPAQVRELGRLESKVQALAKARTSKPAPQQSGAPAPIAPVRPVAASTKDLSDPNLSDADFERILRQKRAKR
jgi:hypothetical protein